MCSQRSNSVTEKWSYRPKILKLKEIQRNTQKICSGWERLLEMPATKHHWLLLGAPELPLLSGCSLRRWSKSKRYRQLPSMSPDVCFFFFFSSKSWQKSKIRHSHISENATLTICNIHIFMPNGGASIALKLLIYHGQPSGWELRLELQSLPS